MLNNKKKDMTPFDMNKKPVKQYPFLLPLIWGGAWLMTRSLGLKVEKAGMEKMKPPYLVLSTHQGFSDYYIAPLACSPTEPTMCPIWKALPHLGNGCTEGLAVSESEDMFPT
ncbi:MAG: hypothetical protein ACLUOI_02235 [Eisenbergiella sp.]